MIKQYDGLYFYIYSYKENVIYNKITDPAGGRSCYPDILIDHGFAESSIEDSVFYTVAVEAQHKYGTAHCFFISAVNDTAVDELADRALSAYNSCSTALTVPDPNAVLRLCEDLRLSLTMRTSLSQLMQYYALTGDVSELIAEVTKRYSLPAGTKLEGKKIYEDIKARILR